MKRIGLVGCVKQKAGTKQPAKDLYLSALFSGRRRYVERSCDEWWILSAKLGLVHPDQIIEPYDLTLKSHGRADRRTWSRKVLAEIDANIRPRKGDTFELHAGGDYSAFGLIEGLKDRGCLIEHPTAGMRLGSQLQFYRQTPRRRR